MASYTTLNGQSAIPRAEIKLRCVCPALSVDGMQPELQAFNIPEPGLTWRVLPNSLIDLSLAQFRGLVLITPQRPGMKAVTARMLGSECTCSVLNRWKAQFSSSDISLARLGNIKLDDLHSKMTSLEAAMSPQLKDRHCQQSPF